MLGDQFQHSQLDCRLRDADLELGDTSPVRKHRRGVLARLADDHLRSPDLEQIAGGRVHRLGAAVRKQLPVYESDNRLRRPRPHLFPDRVDHRLRWLAPDPECDSSLAGCLRQGRRHEHQRIVAEPAESPCRRDHRREVTDTPKRAAKQHAHDQNITKRNAYLVPKMRGPAGS